jgi:hypothetical protein
MLSWDVWTKAVTGPSRLMKRPFLRRMLTHADVCCMLTYADVCRASEEEGLLAQPAATAASVQRGSHGPPEKGSHAPPPPEAGVLSPPEGGSHGPPADRGCLSAFALRAARLGCRCMLTYAHVCSRMLTYAHVCSRMLTYADVCTPGLQHRDLCDSGSRVS